MSNISVIEADITTLAVDAIVNAANERMLGGGGVDGAIHGAAGPALYEACRAVPEVRPGVRCPTGEARITSAGNLPAKFVIHTAGPIWQGGRAGEAELLASCHRNALRLAIENGARSIAFPAISTGIYGYPIERAARVAIDTVRDVLGTASESIDVTFACFSREAAAAFEAALAAADGESPR